MREVRVKIDLVVEVEGPSLPTVRDVGSAIADVARVIVPSAVSVRPGGKLSIGLTRASSIAARRASRGAR